MAPRASTSKAVELGPLMELSANSLEGASHDELVKHITDLQSAVRTLQAKGLTMSKEQLEAKVEQSRSIAARGIAKVISRWVPTARSRAGST